MIYVSKDQFRKVRYLIDQSIRGNHVLFDSESIKRVFGGAPSRIECQHADQDSTQTEDAYEVEHHLERIITQPTLTAKREYIGNLDPDTLSRVVRTYFTIIENNLAESREHRH